MRVITNAESVTATQNNPIYRSSLAQHTRNQIDSLSKKAPHTDICSTLTLALSPSALASPLDLSLLPYAEPLKLAAAEDTQRSLANPDYGDIAEKAIRTEPSPLDLSFGVATSGPSPDDSERAEPKTPPTTKTTSGSFSDASTHLQSPESPQIWKLDPSHTLANLGLAFGLNMADSSQQQPHYPWESAPRDSGPFNQRQSGFGGSSMAPSAPQQGVPSGFYSQNVQIPNYPQQHASSSSSAFATDYPPFSQHAQQAGLDQNYTSIDPARLGTGNDQYYGQNYAFGQQKPSPISPGLSHPQSPLTLHPYHQGGPSHSGPRSAEAGSSLGLLGTNPDRWDGERPRRRSDDGPYLHAHGSTSYQAKRKGTWAGGKTDLAMIKQELDFLAQTEQEVAEMKNDLPSGDRKERRRMQNRLAQRAFRARSKVHHQEVSKHINDLEDLTDNQGGEIDRLEHLVERLQRENMLLRKAVDWSALGLGEDTPGMEQKRDSPA